MIIPAMIASLSQANRLHLAAAKQISTSNQELPAILLGPLFVYRLEEYLTTAM